jgi:hypothetical protein
MSRKWMIIIGVVVVVVVGGIALLYANLGNIVNSAMDTPEGKQGFVDGFKKNCTSSAKAATAGKVPDAKIDAYCDCSAQGMLASVSGDDLVELLKGQMSPAVQQKVNTVVAQCQSTLK